jgi:hypothetical protein
MVFVYLLMCVFAWKEHEDAFERLLADEGNYVVALYPGPEAMEPGELKARLAEQPEKQLVV